METRDDDASEVAPPPAWVLSTPTRRREVWTLPALAAALAVLLALLGPRFGETLGLVVGVTCAVVVAAGAVALAVAGQTAYDAQTMSASWRLHVVRVVVCAVTAVVVAVGGLVVGLPFGVFFGVFFGVGAMTVLYTTARTVPRLDLLVGAWASIAVAAPCVALAVVALAVVGLPESQRAAWVAGGVLGVFSALLAILQFRLAARTPPDQDAPQ